MRKRVQRREAASVRHRPASKLEPPAVTARFGGTPGMDAVIGETVALFHRLRVVSEQIHGQGEVSSGRWGVMRSLAQAGPQTVPQLARSRPVSRQYIQTLVDGLAEQGLIEGVANPAHKRSPLLRLTPKGQTLLEDMNKKAARVLKQLSSLIPDEELRRTASTLRAVRELFAGNQWEQALKRLKPT